MPHRSATAEGAIIAVDGTSSAFPSTSFQLTWPAGEDVPHSIPSLPAYQLTPPAIVETEGSDYVMNTESSDTPIRSSSYGGTHGGISVPDSGPPRRPAFPPRFNRAFSTPLPNQLRHLKHPSRNSEKALVVAPVNPLPPLPPAVPAHFQELALELADSVQMVIQTLIQLSPPHVLDPAKEQLAACSLQLPTPSVAALLTTMKNLNYMSANLPALSTPSPSDRSSRSASPSRDGDPGLSLLADVENMTKVGSAEGEEIITSYPTTFATDIFDVGEVMQSVGDVLSGLAAQAGVDLVLFHADVGMKHVSVSGDECGISYALCHVLRQIINTCQKGDTIELGLFISAPLSSPPERRESSGTVDDRPVSPSFMVDMVGPLMCTFEITHKFGSPSRNKKQTLGPADGLLPRPTPQFSTVILQRLLRHVKATLQTDVPSQSSKGSPSTQRSYELSVLLSPGGFGSEQYAIEDTPDRQPFQGFELPKEPTLDELADFVQMDSEGGLKGKKAVFHACESSSFAHHLTSYLTVWGLDVSHMPTDDGSEDGPLAEGEWPSDSEHESFSLIEPKPRHYAASASSNDQSTKISPIPESFEGEMITEDDAAVAANDIDSAGDDYGSARNRGANQGYGLTDLSETSFVIIDDDVKVLRRRLRQIKRMIEMRNHQVFQHPGLHSQVQNLKKRPSLTPHHRPKSSPAVRLQGMQPMPGVGVLNQSMDGVSNLGAVNTSPGGTPLPTPSINGSPSTTAIPGAANIASGGMGQNTIIDPTQVVVVHFTSLSNYKIVKDTIQATLYSQSANGYFGQSPSSSVYGGSLATSPGWFSAALPEVLVIPKPAGPRRFLTALHTAVRKPYVDPFFSPIATSPMSPSAHYGLGSWNAYTGGGPSEASSRNNSYMSTGRRLSGSTSASNGRVPTLSSTNTNGITAAALATLSNQVERIDSGDVIPVSATSSMSSAVPSTPSLHGGLAANHVGSYAPLPPSPLRPESLEYFTENTVSPSAGMLLHSPDGRPAGIYFQPQSSRNLAAAMSGGSGAGGGIRSDSSYFGKGTVVGSDGRRMTSLGSQDSIIAHGGRSNSSNNTKPGRSSSVGYIDLGQVQGLDTAMATVQPSNGPITPGSQPGNPRSRPSSSSGAGVRANSGPMVLPRKSSAGGGDDPGRPAFTRMASANAGLALGRTPPALGRRSESMPPTSPDLKLPSTLNSGMPSPSIATTGDHPFPQYPTPLARHSRRPSLEPSTPRALGTSPQASPVSSTSITTQPSLSPTRRVNRRASSETKATGAAVTSPGGQPKKKAAPEVGSIVPPINVLIAEDNPINQTILSTFMKRKKIKYAVAKNGQEAVEKWKNGGYHLILMDIQMPVKDGIEATKEIRQLEKERNIGIFPTTPPVDPSEGKPYQAPVTPASPYRSSVIIVALTASNLKSDRVEALAAGCNDFLTKPVSLVWLNNKVIEWGSIKVLEMFQDPATARLFSSQSAKSKSIASHLKLPPSRAPSPIIPASEATGTGSDAPTTQIRPTFNVHPPSEETLPLVEVPPAPPAPNGTPLDSHLRESDISTEAEQAQHAPSTPTISHQSFPPLQPLGDQAILRHIAETQKLEDCKRHSNSPILLGERAMNSENSSTSIASVLYNTLPLGSNDPEAMVSPEVFVPVVIPSSAPGPGPSTPPSPSSTVP